MYKYLIINHIPRCGGSSIKQSFFQAYKYHQYFSNYPVFIPDYTHNSISLYENPQLIKAIHPDTKLFIDHSPALFLEKHFKLNIEETYRFITIRHPVDRIISHIEFFYEQPFEQLDITIIKAFINRFGNLTIEYLTNGIDRYKNKSLEEKTLISIDILKNYNFIFKVEEQKLMEEFNSTNPFEIHLSNFHLNRSKIPDRKKISQKFKNIIYNNIKKEIKLLENYYEMDL